MTPVAWWILGAVVALLAFQWWRGKRTTADEPAREDPEVERERREQARKEFWEKAKRVKAKVLSAYGTGARYNLEPVIALRLRIEGPDGGYDVEVEQAIDPIDLARLTPGKVVSVYIDPSKRDRIKLVDASTEALLDDSDEMLGKAE